MNYKVAIIMGSASDYPIMKEAEEMLKGFEIPTHVEVVSAHRTPEKMVAFVQAWENKAMDKFHALNNELMPLHYAMVAEPNPMPVKAAMEIVEKCSGEVRLPLVTASNSTVERLRKLL